MMMMIMTRHSGKSCSTKTRTSYQKPRLTQDGYVSRQTGFNMKSLHPNMWVRLYAIMKNCARLVKTSLHNFLQTSPSKTFSSAPATKPLTAGTAHRWCASWPHWTINRNQHHQSQEAAHRETRLQPLNASPPCSCHRKGRCATFRFARGPSIRKSKRSRPSFSKADVVFVCTIHQKTDFCHYILSE